jgi:type I restriction enzyme S subunit
MSSVVPEGWSLKPVGEMISESRIALAQDNSSKRLAVRLNLNGIGKRSERATDQVGATKYFSRRAGQFVYGKQNLHKGAFGIIPYSFDGFSSSQDIPAFDFNVDVHPYWFNQYFQQKDFYEGLERIASGTGSKRIQPKDLYLEVLLTPPLPEQKKIASIITSVDKVIENTQKQIDKLQDLKKATMNELLTKGIGHTEFKDSELGRIPKSWEVVNYSQVLKSIDSGWSPSCIEIPPNYGEWGVLKVSAVTKGNFLENESKTLPTGEQPRPNLLVKKGDILLTRANGNADLVGKCVRVSVTPRRNLMLSDKILRFNPNLNIDPLYLQTVFNSFHTRKQIELSWGGSSGQKNISQSDIKCYKLPLPSIPEQLLISKALSNLEETISFQVTHVKKLTDLKKSLMQDLLTGKVRVTVN